MNKHFLDKLYKSHIKENEGYFFLFRDEIYIPVYKYDLKVTIRETLPLNLVEEKILQLLEVGVYQIEELAKILGINRRLLETTIADMSVKDMISVTSERCTLITKGFQALENLNSVRKTQETLKEIYIEALSGKLLIDVNNYHLVDNSISDDNKLKANILQDDITTIRENFRNISELFSREFANEVESEKQSASRKEILSIDDVEKTYVTFIRLSIAVFVSTNGKDIDIQPVSGKERELITAFKDNILLQINEKRFLRKHFRRMTIRESYRMPVYEKNEDVEKELKQYYYHKKKSNAIEQKVRDIVFSQRKLNDGEAETIIEELSSDANDVTLVVDNLDDWAYDYQFVSKLSGLVGKAKFHIIYSYTDNERRAIKRIERGINVTDVSQEDKGQYICWEFDGSPIIYGSPVIYNVINNETTCVVTNYYLSRERE